MPPFFPEVDRIELANSPLDLVVCQLRFPTILALVGNQPPADFQAKIYEDYPIVRKRQTQQFAVGPDMPPQLQVSTFWGFEDIEAQWIVSLGENFVSLETRKYQTFDEFIDRFLRIVEIIKSIYPLNLAERLGLRYVDMISRQRHPQLPEDWVSKVRQDVLALRSACSAEDAQFSTLESRFAFGSQVLAVRSQYIDAGFPGAVESQLNLDFDCYTEQRGKVDEILPLLHEFKDLAYRAFRWAIGDLIHDFPVAGSGEAI